MEKEKPLLIITIQNHFLIYGLSVGCFFALLLIFMDKCVNSVYCYKIWFYIFAIFESVLLFTVHLSLTTNYLKYFKNYSLIPLVGKSFKAFLIEENKCNTYFETESGVVTIFFGELPFNN